MSANDGNLLLTGGVRLPQRVQHPSVIERRDRGEPYWYIRYRHDEIRPDGKIRTTRKLHVIGPSRGDLALSKKAAEVERDKFLLEINVAPSRCEGVVAQQRPAEVRSIIFGHLAERWLTDHVHNRKVRLKEPTREKYSSRMRVHILPRWKDARLGDLEDSKAILDWLHSECTSWEMMRDLRTAMSRVITCAQEWNVIPRSYANPLKWVKIGRKWTVRENRILGDDETASVFARLKDPVLLICEICLFTGTRISEVLGLQLKHFDSKRGSIRIEQRNSRGDIDEPKTKSSKRTLALGTLVDRVQQWISTKMINLPNEWIFPQKHDRSKPAWDSGIRPKLKAAALDAGCDFPGFGLHSFRRANITMRQEEGATAIEASKIAGHSNVDQTSDYTTVKLERQAESTVAIQDRMAKATAENPEKERQKLANAGAAC